MITLFIETSISRSTFQFSGGTSHLREVDLICTKSGNIGRMLSHIIDLMGGRVRVRESLILHIKRASPILRQ